jgi:hypothetical protein
MRVLGVRHATATKASKAKGAMQEDAAKGWTLITSSHHADRADYSQHMDSWWHSDEASTEDNAHKRPVRIYHEPDPVTGELKYELHYPREQNDSDNAMLALWRDSVACEAMKRATVTKKRPQGCVGGKRQLFGFRCRCVGHRRHGKCDCTICTLVILNTPLFHRRRAGWWQNQSTHAFSDKNHPYRKASRNVESMMEFLYHPNEEVANYTLPTARKPFSLRPKVCVEGRCFKLPLYPRDACGWCDPPPPASRLPYARVSGGQIIRVAHALHPLVLRGHARRARDARV